MKVFDNYEISPCTRTEEPDSPGKFYFEVCEPEEAHVWTLYGHLDGEGAEAIGDFATREHAEETFQRITGIPFTGSRDVAEQLRVMHAGPKLLDVVRQFHQLCAGQANLCSTATEAERTRFIDSVYDLWNDGGKEAVLAATGRPG